MSSEKVTLTTTDRNYLAAAQQVLEKHKELGMKPASGNALSTLLGDRNAYSPVKSRYRHVSDIVLKRFADTFGFDLQLFAVEGSQQEYDPENYNEELYYGRGSVTVTGGEFSINSGGDTGNATVVQEGATFTLIQGDVNHYVDQAKQALNELPQGLRDKFEKAIFALQQEVTYLKKELEVQKKMADSYKDHIDRLLKLYEQSQADLKEANARAEHWIGKFMAKHES